MDTGSHCGSFVPAGFWNDYDFTTTNEVKLHKGVR